MIASEPLIDKLSRDHIVLSERGNGCSIQSLFNYSFPYKYRVTSWVHIQSFTHGNPSYLSVNNVGLVNRLRIRR